MVVFSRCFGKPIRTGPGGYLRNLEDDRVPIHVRGRHALQEFRDARNYNAAVRGKHEREK